MSNHKRLWVLLFYSYITFSISIAENVQEITKPNVVYSSPIKDNNVFIAEHFDDEKQFHKQWVVSKAKKPDVSEDLAQYNGEWKIQPLNKYPLDGDKGLVLVSESRHAAIVAKFDKAFVFDRTKSFILQYVVSLQKSLECGGAYVKLLTDGALKDLSLFNDKTPYTIMFGPDKCGGNSKLHFIIRHKNPLNGTITEKHCTKLKLDEAMFKNQEPYLFKLIIEPTNDFSVYINNELQYRGNLLDEDAFDPPFNPPKEIVDESDNKPEDWDDRAQIPDPNAVKPEDWDENEPLEIMDTSATKPSGWLDNESPMIPDESATKPDDWDNEMDGEWEAPSIDNPVCKSAPGCGPWNPPMIHNPKYKGKWNAPFINNPNFKGVWTPRKIPNPEYYYDENPLHSSPIGYIGFELWSLSSHMYFDDILVTDNENTSNEWIKKTWNLKVKNQLVESITVKGRILKALNFSPGWWLIYGVYCLIPILLYIYYMKEVIKKETLIHKLFVDLPTAHPWLYVVYATVVFALLGIITYCCCLSRPNVKDYSAENDSKKTDEYIPDYEKRENNSNDHEKIIKDVESEDNNEEDESDPEEKTSKPSSDEEQNDTDKEVPQESPRSSPRRRKPRRD